MARKQTQSVNTKSTQKTDFVRSSSVNPSPSAEFPKPAHGAKSAFVLALPPEMSAKEVIAKAKSQGLTLNKAHVYNIRSVAKARPTKDRAPNVEPVSIATAPKHRGFAARTSGGDESETRMRKLIAELGLARARAVLAEVLQAFG